MKRKVFVFGSNTQGIHGAGAAKYARTYYGAEIGIGEGPTGWSYALPTKLSPKISMGLLGIKESVNNFMTYALSRHELDFKVTQVGCGRAGWTAESIAPLFVDQPWVLPNVWYDSVWREFMPGIDNFWGTV